MSINKILVLVCISLIISGCQIWQPRDVDSLPPTATQPKVSKPGVVYALYWNSISGNKVSSLTSLSDYPQNPDEIIELSELRGPVNRSERYGVLVQGFIIPPADGTYRFQVSGGDETEFWLAKPVDYGNPSLFAYVPEYTEPEDYGKYSEQTSDPVVLDQGQRYYFEIRYKEGYGTDHFSVAWEGPGFSQQIIRAANLASMGQSIYPESAEIRESYSLGYRVGYLDGAQDLAFNQVYPPLDRDLDGLYDQWELSYGLNPDNPSDAVSDPDGDLLSAADEFLLGTEENNPDTDNDEIPDGVEFAQGLNPLDPADAQKDMDSDGFTNLAEYQAGTDLSNPEEFPHREPLYIGGFLGQYFEGKNFDRFVVSQQDLAINFNWGGGQPLPELPSDQFSVRWSGLLTAPHSSGTRNYRFTTRTDDGVRLFLDDQLIVDRWRDQGPTSYSHTQSLEAGAAIKLTMEYYENGGGAVAQLTVTDTTTGQTVSTETAIKAPDPADTHTQDTDLDGIPDAWELRHGLNPWENDANNFSNQEGITNLKAYEAGLDPWTLEPVPTPDSTPIITEPIEEEPALANGTVIVSWTAPLTRTDGSSISPGEIDSYRLFYGLNPEDLDRVITVDGTATSAEVTNLEPGTWYFAMQAIDTNGLEGPLSDTVSYLAQ